VTVPLQVPSQPPPFRGRPAPRSTEVSQACRADRVSASPLPRLARRAEGLRRLRLSSRGRNGIPEFQADASRFGIDRRTMLGRKHTGRPGGRPVEPCEPEALPGVCRFPRTDNSQFANVLQGSPRGGSDTRVCRQQVSSPLD
jgi:hypothetical protein